MAMWFHPTLHVQRVELSCAHSSIGPNTRRTVAPLLARSCPGLVAFCRPSQAAATVDATVAEAAAAASSSAISSASATAASPASTNLSTDSVVVEYAAADVPCAELFANTAGLKAAPRREFGCEPEASLARGKRKGATSSPDASTKKSRTNKGEDDR